MLLLVDVDIETGYPPIEPRMLFQAPVETAISVQNCGQGATLEHLRVFDLSSGLFVVNPDQDVRRDHPIDLRDSVSLSRKERWLLPASVELPMLYYHGDVRLEHQACFQVPAGHSTLDGSGQVRLENSGTLMGPLYPHPRPVFS